MTWESRSQTFCSVEGGSGNKTTWKQAYIIPTHTYLYGALGSAKIVVDNGQVPTCEMIYPQNALNNVPPEIDIAFS